MYDTLLSRGGSHTYLTEFVTFYLVHVQAGDIIDSYVSSTIPQVFHDAGKARKQHPHPAQRAAPRHALTPCPLPTPGPVTESYKVTDPNWIRTMEIIESCQKHETHVLSCRKGIIGRVHCRFCCPRGRHEPPTGPVEIEPVYVQVSRTKCVVEARLRGDGTVTTPPYCNQHLSINHAATTSRTGNSTACVSSTTRDLVGPRDDRLIAWELHRSTSEDMQVIEYSPTLSACVASNATVSILGDSLQAKSIIYYMLKYMTKDSTSLNNVLPLILEAQQTMDAYGSTAADKSEPLRMFKFLTTRTLNNLSGRQEISASQAASALMGFGSTICSSGFWYCYHEPARQQMMANHFPDTQSPVYDETSNSSSPDPVLDSGPGSDDDNDFDTIATMSCDNQSTIMIQAYEDPFFDESSRARRNSIEIWNGFSSSGYPSPDDVTDASIHISERLVPSVNNTSTTSISPDRGLSQSELDHCNDNAIRFPNSAQGTSSVLDFQVGGGRSRSLTQNKPLATGHHPTTSNVNVMSKIIDGESQASAAVTYVSPVSDALHSHALRESRRRSSVTNCRRTSAKPSTTTATDVLEAPIRPSVLRYNRRNSSSVNKAGTSTTTRREPYNRQPIANGQSLQPERQSLPIQGNRGDEQDD